MRPLKFAMNPLSRRTVLRGAAGTAIALPWLEAMVGTNAHAAEPPRRLILWFTSNGTIRPKWIPNRDAAGTITGMTSMMAPLESLKSKILMLTGVDMMSAEADTGDTNHGSTIDGGHAMPSRHKLCGRAAIQNNSSSGLVGGISIDKEIANRIGRPGIDLGVQVTGEGMTSTGPRTSIRPINDPLTAFNKFLANVTPGQPGPAVVDPALVRLQKRRQSVLDAVKPEFDSLKTKIGASDATRIDTHLASLRALELSAQALTKNAMTVSTPATCSKPATTGWPKDQTAGNFIPAAARADFKKLGYAQMDLLAAAVGCDVTRVGTLEWGGTTIYSECDGSMPAGEHHELSHSDPAAIEKIQTWFAGHFAYMANKLNSMPEGNGTVLDNTALVWFQDIGHGGGHNRFDIPYVIAGGAGGYIKTGRFLDLNPTGDHGANGWPNPSHSRKPPYGRTHNDLYLTFLDMMGVPAASFGDAQFCKGTIPLT